MSQKSPDYVVGVDIGGTNMSAAVVAGPPARILTRRRVPTEPRRGPEDGLRRLSDLIDQVISDADAAQIGGIGIGCTGPVDSIKGTVHNPYTLPTWDGLSLVAPLSARFSLPVVLLNDCDVAALGEHWAGAGRGTRHMLYITVSTGIGGGIIIDNRLHIGVGLTAGEIGHHVIDLNGPPCYCGARGCWEMLAAAPAIARFAAERAADGSLLLELAGGDREQITSETTAHAATQGDPAAKTVMEQTAFYLGVGVTNLINILAPEAVILGGGVIESWPLLAPTLLATANARGTMLPFDQVKIAPAGLGTDAGVVGAARAIWDYLHGRLPTAQRGETESPCPTQKTSYTSL